MKTKICSFLFLLIVVTTVVIHLREPDRHATAIKEKSTPEVPAIKKIAGPPVRSTAIIQKTTEADVTSPNSNNEEAVEHPALLSSNHINYRKAAKLKQFVPRAYQQGVDHLYICGNGYGHTRMRTIGTTLPPIQQKYFADKGKFLVGEFRRITGISPPPGFFFQIFFFKNKADYERACLNLGMRAPPAAFCQPTANPLYSPIMVPSTGDSSTVDVIAHEMIHAIAIASYGDLPQCFDEGIADWLGFSYRHRIPNASNFYHQADLKFLAYGIRTGSFPSLDSYLASESYADWAKTLPSISTGYNIGSMLMDHLWNHHRQFLLKGLAYCRQFPNNVPARSRAFRYYVGKNWPGGWRDIDRRFQNWILDRAQYSWRPDK